MPPTLDNHGWGFVGRTHQLRRVEAAAASLTDGQGSVVVVSGEPGVGKTRFCDEVARRADQAGLRVVVARCWTEGGAPPLWPWQPILAELCGDGAPALLTSGAAVDYDRFSRFVAVTDRLAAACARSPACVVIDDVQAADAGTLLLLRFMARSLARLALVLVLTRRPGEPAPGSREARLLEELSDEGSSVVLDPFDEEETAAFLVEHGVSAPRGDLVRTLYRLTAGHPLFLRRIVQTNRDGDGERTFPLGLQIAIQQAVASLEREPRDLLAQAALLGLTPPVSGVADLVGREPVAVLDAVRACEGTGLVTTQGTERLAFSHELVRTAFEQSLSVAERMEAHARAARAIAPDLSGPADRLARAAHHAHAAAPLSAEDACRAIAASQAAARAMVRSFAYEQAEAWLSAAVELHEPAHLGEPSADLTLQWAQASLLCGNMAQARIRFDQAATRAGREGNEVAAAEAALGLGGVWLNEHRTPVERARVLGLQRAALDALPDHEHALRCRLTARLVSEEAFDGGLIEPVHEVLEAARRSGDRLVLAEALSLAHHALFTPPHVRTRLQLADELVRVASESGFGVLGLMGLMWRTVDLFHLGHEGATRALEALRERANALNHQNLLYTVAVMDVMLLIRQGRFEDAEAAAWQCHDLGEAVGDPDAVGYLSSQLLTIRWIQDRDAELLTTVDDVAASPSLISAEFALRASAAAIAARTGDHERARADLDRLAPNGFGALPQSSTWAAGMVAIVEAAAVLDAPDIAAPAYDLLLPSADLPVIASLAVACLGSTERSLGIAASVLGKHDLAVDHLERAIGTNLRLGNRPMVAIARADLARVLRRRDCGATEDRRRAADLLARAAADAEAMQLHARATGWRDELRDVQLGSGRARRPGAGSNGADPHLAPPPRQGTIHRLGLRWFVALGEERARVGDLVGMPYLRELLAHPGQPIPALALAARADAPGGAPQDMLDDQARRAYLARARELTEELAEAEGANDLVRAEWIRDELDILVEELETATGLNGRSRQFTNDAERARTAVRKAIKRAIDAIERDASTMAEIMRTSVTTGSTCMYVPDPQDPIVWSTNLP